MPTILVLGGNFGGMTSAFELRRKLGAKARVVVVSKQKEFVYIPSLIWVPFGRRRVEDITFSAEETLRKRGIEFVHDEVIAKLDQATGRFTEYDVPLWTAQPYDVNPDPEGNIWFADSPTPDRVALISKFNPRTRAFVFYPKPQFAADTPKIQVTRDGAIWFTDPGYGSLMEYEGHRLNKSGSVQPFQKEAIYRIDAQTGKMDKVADQPFKPNGLCFSPDFKKVYVADTGVSHYPNAKSVIWVYDIDGERVKMFAVGSASAGMAPRRDETLEVRLPVRALHPYPQTPPRLELRGRGIEAHGRLRVRAELVVRRAQHRSGLRRRQRESGVADGGRAASL